MIIWFPPNVNAIYLFCQKFSHKKFEGYTPNEML